MTKKRTDDQKTPIMRRPRRKTPDAELPVTTCPHCRRDDVQIMPSRLLALHTARGAWKRRICRGSGDPVDPVPAVPAVPTVKPKRR